MAKKDWYRNKTWSPEIEADFEEHLKRARGTFSKAQYVKVQGIELLNTDDKSNHEQALKLLQRVIEEYPMEKMMVEGSLDSLADHYLEIEDLEKAEYHFRILLKLRKKQSSETYEMGELKLAKTILKSNQADKFDEACKYLIKHSKTAFTFNNERFYFAELGALLCEKMKKHEEASVFARKALELSRVTAPDFSRHKDIGLVDASEHQLKTLRKIAGLE
jgi:tetratricopeptide (TPR) repeat protein